MNGTMRAGIDDSSPKDANTYAEAVITPENSTNPSSVPRRMRATL